jgi:hypothetical protein
MTESRKIGIGFECMMCEELKLVAQLESCGTVPNPEKSRLSRPAGQSGRDNIEKNRSPEFLFD